jgi:hypothetical protein
LSDSHGYKQQRANVSQLIAHTETAAPKHHSAKGSRSSGGSSGARALALGADGHTKQKLSPPLPFSFVRFLLITVTDPLGGLLWWQTVVCRLKLAPLGAVGGPLVFADAVPKGTVSIAPAVARTAYIFLIRSIWVPPFFVAENGSQRGVSPTRLAASRQILSGSRGRVKAAEWLGGSGNQARSVAAR